MGGISINSGFYWGSTTGIYYDILGRVCDRLAGGAASPEGDGWHAYPAGGYFSVMKSRQKNFI